MTNQPSVAYCDSRESDVRTYRYEPWPEVQEGVRKVEFRLVYHGRLPAASATTRSREKHAIRREIHKQLIELWKRHPRLRTEFESSADPTGMTGIKRMAKNYSRCGYEFLPLIPEDLGVGCSLDILFLRRDQPGDLIKSGGDIDNRLKVLLDALKVPRTCDEIPNPPGEGESPFFCLLEDDKLITEIKVTTDRLLLPAGLDEHLNDVHLVIHVRTIILNASDIGAFMF